MPQSLHICLEKYKEPVRPLTKCWGGGNTCTHSLPPSLPPQRVKKTLSLYSDLYPSHCPTKKRRINFSFPPCVSRAQLISSASIFAHLNSIWCGMHLTQFLIIQFSSVSHNFLSPKHSYFLQQAIFKYPQSSCSHNVTDQVHNH